jgi:hypothetical protein
LNTKAQLKTETWEIHRGKSVRRKTSGKKERRVEGDYWERVSMPWSPIRETWSLSFLFLEKYFFQL